MNILKKIQIDFWKIVAIVWDIRPRKLPHKYSDYPIAYTPIIPGQDIYEYPKEIRVLYEWEEKGHKWIVFSR